MTLTEYIAHLRQDRGESVDLRYERLRIARDLENLTLEPTQRQSPYDIVEGIARKDLGRE